MDINFKNRDRLVQLGIAIASLRKIRGMSQEQLAEKAGLSRSLISLIEAPGVPKNFTLDAFYSIADALAADPAVYRDRARVAQLGGGRARHKYSGRCGRAGL